MPTEFCLVYWHLGGVVYVFTSVLYFIFINKIKTKVFGVNVVDAVLNGSNYVIL